MCTLLVQLASILALAAYPTQAQAQTTYPHVDECNFCAKCLVEGDAAVPTDTQISEQLWRPEGDGHAHLLAPTDEATKVTKPNCTVCRGCNVHLTSLDSETISFAQTLTFKHGTGATNSWLFFARRPGSSRRYIVKVFCIPVSKDHGLAKVMVCRDKVYSRRTEIMLANQKLAAECGVQELYPRMWLGKISATLPGFGYHIRWHGLWMEEARGATLAAVDGGANVELTLYHLLSEKMNSTQVLSGAIMDLLSSQCDRHMENVFIDEAGQMQFIDQDKSLGTISKCGYDTLLIPGTRYHSVLRVGFWNKEAEMHRSERKRPGFCSAKVAMRTIVDYRCHIPGLPPGEAGTLGTNYPANFKRCISSLANMSAEEIAVQYRLSDKQPALYLQSRAADMLNKGFEWTMDNGVPRNKGRYVAPHQPPCCKLVLEKNRLACNKCWKPLYPEDISNSTNMNLVSPLHE